MRYYILYANKLITVLIVIFAYFNIAPEEVMQKKKGRNAAFLSEADIGRDDRRRLRRATKAANKKEKLAKPLSERVKEDQKLTSDLQKDRRVVSGKVSGSSEGNNRSSSSSSFFQKIQAQVQGDISKQKGTGNKNSTKMEQKSEGGPKSKGASFKM